MVWLDLLRWLHVIGAAVLLGTGAGIAVFMVMAHRSGDVAAIAHTTSTVVVADWLFTASAVVLQPVTGLVLAYMIGWSLTEGWILASIGLYLLVGAFWLPVVRIQIRLRDIARVAASNQSDLPAEYWRLYRIWFACGFPAFIGVLTIIYLMVARPSL